MAMKPVIHGRDHLPGGADPIPAVAATGGGIQFDTYPQSGNWLRVRTLDANGMRFLSDLGGIDITSSDPTYDLSLGSGRDILLSADRNWNVTALGSSQLDITGNVLLNSGSGKVEIDTGTFFKVDASTYMQLIYRGSNSFSVWHGSSEVFRLDSTGTAHLLTGSTILYDL